MSQRRSAALRIARLGGLLILALAAALLLVGCLKKKPEAGGRLALGGQEAADVAAEETGAAQAKAPAAEQEAAQAGASARGAGAGRGGAQRGGPRGGGRRAGGGGGPVQASGPAAAPSAGKPEKTSAPGKTGISKVDDAAKVRDFAAVYGPVSQVEEQDWNGDLRQWIAFTYDSSNPKLVGRRFKLPLSMVTDAVCPEILEGYFPIYGVGVRPSGKVVSTQTISAPRRPKRSPTEVKKLVAKATPAPAAPAAGAATGAAGAQAMGGPRGGGGRMGGGPRGGRMGGGPRGGPRGGF